MKNEPIKIQVDDQPRRPSAERSRSISIWIASLGVALIVFIVVGAIYIIRSNQKIGPVANKATRNSESSQTRPQVLTDETEQQAIVEPVTYADDGKSLWVSPTAGEPLDCRYLLPGTQLILHVRMADMFAHPEGLKLLAALGPWGEQVTQIIELVTGKSTDDIQTLTLGVRQSVRGTLDYSLCLQARQPVGAASLRPGCFIPRGETSLLAWCTPSASSELKAQGDQPPFFSRELQRVLDRTDQRRLATLVFAGKFLQISGEKFLSGAGEKLQTAVVDFLGDEATASAISAHWDENFFLELQSTVVLSERPHRFAQVLDSRVAESSDSVEDAILAQQLPAYSRKVLARFPSMLRKLGNYTRAGEDDKLSLLRCYLPVTAGHNLLMASELMLNVDRMGGASSTAVAETQSEPTSLADRLAQSTSLVFPKETLQKALEILSEDTEIPIEIAGRDLQLEGITKNQSLALELRDKPASEILLAILLRANPDRTATGPTDERQKLVYVVRQAVDGKPSAIVVTTRSAANGRGEKLPSVFQSSAR